jgi:uncharacterized short protein YbdD (DUF466 family)
MKTLLLDGISPHSTLCLANWKEPGVLCLKATSPVKYEDLTYVWDMNTRKNVFLFSTNVKVLATCYVYVQQYVNHDKLSKKGIPEMSYGAFNYYQKHKHCESTESKTHVITVCCHKSTHPNLTRCNTGIYVNKLP